MKSRVFVVAAILSAFFMLPLVGGAAYAAEPDPAVAALTEQATGETLDAPPIPAIEGTVTPENTSRPFTPVGTGTVIDLATDADGKVFYTIITPAENVFYLVIDRQRGQENVYFLNAVTEADLLALAEMPPAPDPAPTAPAQPTSPTESEPTPEQPEPEHGGGNMGMIILVIAVVIIGGGAGYYLKIYRPKQQQADSEEDYRADGGDPYGEDGAAWLENDNAPWYDGNEPGEDGE